MRWLEDSILRWLQHRCGHPGWMVSADILEGDGAGVRVAYCNRCGATRIWHRIGTRHVEEEWRRPDPHLWRNREG